MITRRDGLFMNSKFTGPEGSGYLRTLIKVTDVIVGNDIRVGEWVMMA